MSGVLYVVATPIGNLEDITYRAVRILKEVDLIICEDTRHSRILFNKYEIRNNYISYHQHSKVVKTDFIIKSLKDGKNIAMISDAGTPGVCDPGEKLIEEAVLNEIQIVPIPGPSALAAVISITGFSTDSFLFLGFLPKKKGRSTLLKKIKELSHDKLYETIMLYVSPYQTVRTINDLYDNLGEKQVVIAREITKKFEELYRGNLSEASEYFTKHQPKGEFVVAIKNT